MVMHPQKTKKLWSGQALLRRSGRRRRKNQTKTICLPSFEGETKILKALTWKPV
jgi:hypothetical protein